MTDVLRKLKDDHTNMSKLLNVLEYQLARFKKGEPPDYDIIQGIVDYCLTYPDLTHHPLEDQIYARLAQQPGMSDSTHDLLKEHEELADLTRRVAAGVRRILGEFEIPREAFVALVQEFIDQYRSHIEKEEAYFFPRAEESLSSDDWAEIEAGFTPTKDPLFGAAGEEQFRGLRQDILQWDTVERT